VRIEGGEGVICRRGFVVRWESWGCRRGGERGTRGSWSKICRLNKASKKKKKKTSRQSQVLRRTFVVKKGKKEHDYNNRLQD